MTGRETLLALAEFFDAAMTQMVDGWDWDGCDMQETAEKVGLIHRRLYNAETDQGMDAGDGDEVWVVTDLGREACALARAEIAS